MSLWETNSTASNSWNNDSSNQQYSNQSWNQSNQRSNQSNNQSQRSVDWSKEVEHVFKEEIRDFAKSFNNQNQSSWGK